MFIENGGGLVYPSSYDFGEDLRFLLLSMTTAAGDKAVKYPTTFNSAYAPIITKSDLADAVECDGAAVGRNL